MNLSIVIIALLVCSVSANPTPQIFGYQPATQVGQWVSNSLQTSLQSVANAIQSITRPSQPPPPGTLAASGVDTYGSIQTFPQPGLTFQSYQPYQPAAYPPQPLPAPYPTQPQPGAPYQPQPQPQPAAPYPSQPLAPSPGAPPPSAAAYQLQPQPGAPPNAPWPNNGVPPRGAQSDEQPNTSTWVPVPLYQQFGEPTIVIISRGPTKPPTQLNETAPVENSSNQQTDQPASSTNSPELQPVAETSTEHLIEIEPNSSSTSASTPNDGTTTAISLDDTTVPELGLIMVNRVAKLPTESQAHENTPNTN